MKIVTCTKCRNRMEPGTILDHSYAAIYQSYWHAGNPRRTMKWLSLDMLKVKYDECLRIDTFRCTHCGYLESYPTEPVKLKKTPRGFEVIKK